MNFLFRFLFVLALMTFAAHAQVLTVSGASSVALPVSDAVAILKAENQMEIEVSTGGGSQGGIDGLGQNRVDVAMVAEELGGRLRAQYPDVIFTPTLIGQQAVAIVVSPDVWNGGIRTISAEQFRKIYQKRVTNWKELGGPDVAITYTDWSRDNGLWEMLMKWAYGDSRRAPPTKAPIVNGSAESLKALNTKPGSIVLMAANFPQAPKEHFLGITDEEGINTSLSIGNVLQDKYPLARPMFLVTNNRPTGDARVLVEFMLSKRGQDIVRKYGYYAPDDLKPPTK